MAEQFFSSMRIRMKSRVQGVRAAAYLTLLHYVTSRGEGAVRDRSLGVFVRSETTGMAVCEVWAKGRCCH